MTWSSMSSPNDENRTPASISSISPRDDRTLCLCCPSSHRISMYFRDRSARDHMMTSHELPFSKPFRGSNCQRLVYEVVLFCISPKPSISCFSYVLEVLSGKCSKKAVVRSPYWRRILSNFSIKSISRNALSYPFRQCDQKLEGGGFAPCRRPPVQICITRLEGAGEAQPTGGGRRGTGDAGDRDALMRQLGPDLEVGDRGPDQVALE